MNLPTDQDINRVLKTIAGKVGITKDISCLLYTSDQEAVAHYYRYCDDGLVLSGSKKYLWKVRDIIHEPVSYTHLPLKHRSVNGRRGNLPEPIRLSGIRRRAGKSSAAKER